MARKVSKKRFLELAVSVAKSTASINGELTYLMEELWGYPPEEGWALLMEMQGWDLEDVSKAMSKMQAKLGEITEG